MKNFLRAVRAALPYRNRLAVSVACALLAAVFWTLTFSSIDPILKILRHGKSLPEIFTAEIEKIKAERIEPAKKEVDRLAKELQDLEAQPGAAVKEVRRASWRLSEAQIRLEQALLERSYRETAKRYADMLLPDEPFQALAVILALVVAGVGVRGVFEFGQESLVASVVQRTQYDLRNRFFRRAIHLDTNNFTETGTHDVMSRFTNDMELIAQGMRTLFGKVIGEPLQAIGCIAAACWISWKLTLMFLILVPVAFFVLTRVGRMMKRATRRLLEGMSAIYKILQESFQGIRIVKAFGREPGERRRMRGATRAYYHKAMWVAYLDALSGPIIAVLASAAIGGALLAGAYLVVTKSTSLFGIEMLPVPMEAETLLQLYALLAAVSDPVRKLSSVYTRIQAGYAAADRVFAYIDREPKVQSNASGPVLARHHRDIEFRDICFSYKPGEPILTGVNLLVRQGETIALVGKNGCGKSTLLSLLPRFYDPDHGTVLVDGVDIRAANLRSVRRQIGVVTQDTFLFDDTIYANIAYGRPRAPREEVEAAARQAHAHDFIMSLPQGYETRAGEAGGMLSGGQKQRISLARAFLMNPAILILDEFTSQADTETEMEVHRILQEYKHGRTTFVITHRLNTLQIADRIVVLDDGRVAATGTHAELLRTCPLYQRLYDAQSHGLAA